ASLVVFKLPPYFDNFGKRVIKSPKYYFIDVGLLTYLLDIETPKQIARDPLLGSIFENLVVLETLKARYNQGQTANLYFFRDSHGNEIDLLHKSGSELKGMEIKAAETWSNHFKQGLKRFSQNSHALARAAVVYNGEDLQMSDGIEAVHFSHAGTWLTQGGN